MGRKRAGRPAVPVHKRTHKFVDSRPFVTDSMTAFNLGRGGYEPSAYIRANYGLWLKWCAGRKQRQQYLDCSRSGGGKPRLTEYEYACEQAEAKRLEANSELARAMLQKRGIPVTQRSIDLLISELEKQAKQAV